MTTCPHCRKPFENLLVLDDNNDVVRRIEVEKKQPVGIQPRWVLSLSHFLQHACTYMLELIVDFGL